MAFLFIPLMATSMSGMAREKMGNATSIYNLMRNIGGSFGIASMTTFLARRGQVHQNQLIAHVTLCDPAARKLMLLLRKARDLRPHKKKPAARREDSQRAAQDQSKPELIGTFH